ncbi:MAG: Yip1 family protein [Gaiellaceae bacterium]
MGAVLEERAAGERAWWLRALLVLGAPRDVFLALRDDSPEASSDRQEPVTAIVFLAGLSAALGAARNVALLEDATFDGLLMAVWVVAAGGVQGLFGYWVLGAALYAGLSAVGPHGPFRHARHLLAYASVPVALAVVLAWPVRLAVFGGDVFREGGSDDGALASALDVLEAGLYAWALALLVLGVRVVHGWSWGRSLAACALAGVVIGAVALALAVGA